MIGNYSGYGKRKFWPFLLFSVSLGFSMIAGELYLRFFRPVAYLKPPPRLYHDPWCNLLHRHSSVPGLDYELVPGREKFARGMVIKTNRYGMRDSEPLPMSLFRIVVVGDSVTFGYGVKGEETYPSVLERLLNQPPTDKSCGYEVLNLGVVGYSTAEEAIALKHKGMIWNPQLVIIGYDLNDPEMEPLSQLHLYFHKPSWWEYSHLFRLMAFARRTWERDVLGGGVPLRFMYKKNGRRWKRVLEAFEAIRETTQARGVKVLMVIFPGIKGMKKPGYLYHDIHGQVSQAAQKNGFLVLDLLPAFSGYDPEALRVSVSDYHPNKLGHSLAAEAIRKKLIAEHLVY